MPIAPVPRVTEADLDAAARETEREYHQTALQSLRATVNVKNRPPVQHTEDYNEPPPQPEPRLVEPAWKPSYGKSKTSLNRSHLGGYLAEIFLFANPQGDEKYHLPDLFPELIEKPVLKATFQSFDQCPEVLHYRKLQRQQAQAEREERLAMARLAELNGKKEALEIEIPADLARKLQHLAPQIQQQQERLAQSRKDLATLKPLLERAQAFAEAQFNNCFNGPYAEAKNKNDQQKRELLDKVAEAIAPFLTRLVALERMQYASNNYRTDAERKMKDHLRTLPEPATT